MLQKANFRGTNDGSELIRVKGIVIGESQAGKTALVRAMADDEFIENHRHTIGVDYKFINIEYAERVIKINLIDTGGGAGSLTLTSSYYHDSHIVFLVVNLADQYQLRHIRDAKMNVERYCTENTPIILVGNRPRDLARRQISDEEIQKIANEHGLTYMEVNIFNQDQVNDLISAALDLVNIKLDGLLNPEPQLSVIFNNIKKVLGTKPNKLDSLIEYLSKLNSVLQRRHLLAKHYAMAYEVKIYLMHYIFKNNLPYLNHPMLPNLFMEYLDALAGLIHYVADMKDALNKEHMPLLKQFLQFVDISQTLQKAVISNTAEFYTSNTTHLFPIDEVFQPYIIKKLISWVRILSPIRQLEALRHLPYFGINQLAFDNIFKKIIDKEYTTNRVELVAILEEYISIQGRILHDDRNELDKLHLAVLRILQHCLFPPCETIIKPLTYISNIESMLISASKITVTQFIQELLNPQESNESRSSYICRITLALFLIRLTCKNLKDLIEDPQFDNNDISLRKDIITSLLMSSFDGLILRSEKKSTHNAEFVIAALDRYDYFPDYNIVASQKQIEVLSKAIEQFIADSTRLEIKYKYTYICDMIFSFIKDNWELSHLVAQFQKIFQIKSKTAEHLCSHIIGVLIESITPDETPESYVERLSAAVSLQAIYPPTKEHHHANMMLLVNAEEVVARTKANQKLSKEDFLLKYDQQLTTEPQLALNNFVATRQGYYLMAMCRCYRQNVSGVIDPFGLVQQYLVVKECQLDISEDSLNIIANIINSQISLREIAILIDNLSISHLALLTNNHFNLLSSFVRFDRADKEIVKSSDGSLEKLAKAIIAENKLQELYNDIQNKPLNINNRNIFIIITTIFLTQQINVEMISLGITIIKIMLKKLFTDKVFINVLKDGSFVPILSRMLESIDITNNQHAEQFNSMLSDVTFYIITESLAYLYAHFSQNKTEYTDIVCCLLDHGANILVPYPISNSQQPKLTNTVLSLLTNGQFDLLTTIFEYYRKNPHAIIDHSGNNYLGINPLFSAITKNANQQFVTLMLELGFSSSLVDSYLLEEKDENVKKEVKNLTKNNDALHALYIFARKGQQKILAVNNNSVSDLASTTIRPSNS